MALAAYRRARDLDPGSKEYERLVDEVEAEAAGEAAGGARPRPGSETGGGGGGRRIQDGTPPAAQPPPAPLSSPPSPPSPALLPPSEAGQQFLSSEGGDGGGGGGGAGPRRPDGCTDPCAPLPPVIPLEVADAAARLCGGTPPGGQCWRSGLGPDEPFLPVR